jgi:hypothetical protein
MKDANALYHSWMKRFGNGAGFFKQEMVKDINAFVGERVSETNKFWLKETERLTNKIYKLEKEIKMRSPVLVIALAIMALLAGLQMAHAFSPITDVQDNLKWTAGEQALVGTAYKVAGSGPVERGHRGDSLSLGIFDYRFIKESYTVINDPASGGRLGDGLKTGLQLNYFLGWFKSPQTTTMQMLNNVNIGPVITVPLLSTSKPFQAVDVWLEANWQFGK